MMKPALRMFTSICTVTAMLIILSGCSAEKGNGDFSLETLPVLSTEELVQFTESEEMLLSSISQLTSDSEGNIILVDARQRIIHAVDPQGNYIQQIGANGSGPGEYQFPGLVSIGPDDALHVMDWASRTIITYQKDDGMWTFSSDFIADQEKVGFLSKLFPLGRDEFYIASGSISINNDENSLLVRRIDRNSDVVSDSILIAPSNENFTIRNGDTAMMSLSQSDMHRQAQFAHDYKGTIYYGWSDSLTIKKMTSESESFEVYADLDMSNAPFTSADADSILGNYESILEGNPSARQNLISSFPDTKPAFRELQADETGHLWIQLLLPDGDDTWLILDQSGEPAYRVNLEAGQNLSAVRNGKAYAISQSDLGVPAVTVFGFDY